MSEREEPDQADPSDDTVLPYLDRMQAADVLARALARHGDCHPLVLAIPRGAVPMGLRLAQALGGELDLVPVRKLGAPGQPELAIGALDGDGSLTRSPGLEAMADERWIAQEAERQRQLLAMRIARYRTNRPPIDPAKRIVIVVDDGLATGATMRAALGWVRRRAPSWLVCAVPVAEAESLDALAGLADEIVCPKRTRALFAVSQFYLRFPQVEDDEVIAALAAQPSGRSSSKRAPSMAAGGPSMADG